MATDLRARAPLVATRVSGGLQQGFCWGFTSFSGSACVLPHFD
jgi:hypothetical protein